MVKTFTRENLEDKIKELYGIDEISTMITQQINKYVLERKWSYLEIARALAYFIGVRGGAVKKEMGIGIVPYVMEESKKYFAQQERLQKQQKEESEQFLKTKDNSYDIECKQLPKRKCRRNTLIDIGTISFEEDMDE